MCSQLAHLDVLKVNFRFSGNELTVGVDSADSLLENIDFSLSPVRLIVIVETTIKRAVF